MILLEDTGWINRRLEIDSYTRFTRPAAAGHYNQLMTSWFANAIVSSTKCL